VANMIKPKFVVLFVLVAVLVAAPGRGQTGTSSPTKVTGKPKSTSSGVQYWDITVGDSIRSLNTITSTYVTDAMCTKSGKRPPVICSASA